MLERLDELDRAAFLAINGAHAPWADGVMALASAMPTWFPVYALLLVVLLRRYGRAAFAWCLPVIALMVLCSDSGSVVLIKNTVQRLRPCHEPALQGLVHLWNGHCGGRYGFVSSHASNHFAIAVFMARALQGRPAWAAGALLGWASFVGYSRIHLGVHYPGDVLAGAVYGGAVGALCFTLFRGVLRWRGVRPVHTP